MSLSRKEAIKLLSDEARLIIHRASLPHTEAPKWGLDNLQWYLNISKDWGLVTLLELSKQKPETLLDIGAYYGLVSGAASRLGWQISAVDMCPIPNFSGLMEEARQVSTQICNVSVDPLPFPNESFAAVLLNEVLEHLVYSPVLLLKEIRRVLIPGGRLYLTTPHPAALSKLLRLALGKNNEPYLEVFMTENDPYLHKGLTFFNSNRESRIWTAEELNQILPSYDLSVVDFYYYGNTISEGENLTARTRIKRRINSYIRPMVKRNRLFGGGMIFIAEAANCRAPKQTLGNSSGSSEPG